MGVFARIMESLASEGSAEKVVMIDATYLKAHRTASGLRVSEADPKSAQWTDFPPNGGPTTSAGA